MWRLFTITILALFTLTFIGCGGGGGNTTEGTRLKLNVHWASRSRAVGAPTPAASAVVHLAGARPDGTDLHWVIPRSAEQAGGIGTYTSTQPIRPGTWEMRVEFRANADGTGDLVGVVSLPVTVAADGSGMPTVTDQFNVDAVTILPDQGLFVGEQRALFIAVTNAQQEQVALLPLALQWRVDAGAEALRFIADNSADHGKAEGLAVGDAVVAVTVADVTSDAQTVTVQEGGALPATGGTITAADGATTLTIPDAAIDQPVRISVEPAVEYPESARLIDDTAFLYTPTNLTFAAPVTLTIRYDESLLPDGVDEGTLRLGTVADGAWQDVLPSQVDATQNTVTASVTRLGIYGVLQPAANTNVVTISDDAPDGSTRFRELRDAVTYLNGHAGAATILIATNRPQAVSQLTLNFHARIQEATGYAGVIQGSSGDLNVNSNGTLAMVDLTVLAGSANFNAQQQLDLIQNDLPPTVVNLGGAASSPSRAGFDGGMTLQGGEIDAYLKVNANARIPGLIDLSQGNTDSLELGGSGTLSSGFEISEMVTDNIGIDVKADGSARCAIRHETGVNNINSALHLSGTPQVVLEDVRVNTDITLKVDGIATATASYTGVRAQNGTYEYAGAAKVTVLEQSAEFEDLKLSAKGSASVTSSSTDTKVTGDLTLLAETETLKLDATYTQADVGGKLALTARGETALFNVKDSEVRGGAEITAEMGTTTGRVDNTKFGANVHIVNPTSGAAAGLYFTADNGAIFNDGATIDVAKGVHAGIEFNNAAFVQGATSVVNGARLAISAITGGNAPRKGKGARSAGRVDTPPSQIIIRDCEFSSPRVEPAIGLYDLTTTEAPNVLIENNRITSGSWGAIVLNNCVLPVTARGNTIEQQGDSMVGIMVQPVGHGVAVGPIFHPYLFEGNTIRKHNAGVGVDAKDLMSLTLLGNTITLDETGTAVMLRGSRAILRNNTLTAATVLGVGIAGAPYPSLADAEGNTFNGKVVLLGPDLGYGRFSGNTFAPNPLYSDLSGLIDPGGLLADPVISNSGLEGNGDNANFGSPIDFDGDGHTDYPDHGYEPDRTCCPHYPLPSEPPMPAQNAPRATKAPAGNTALARWLQPGQPVLQFKPLLPPIRHW